MLRSESPAVGAVRQSPAVKGSDMRKSCWVCRSITDREHRVRQAIARRNGGRRGSARMAMVVTLCGMVIAAGIVVTAVYVARTRGRSQSYSSRLGLPADYDAWEGVIPDSIVNWAVRAEMSLVRSHTRPVPGARFGRVQYSTELKKGVYVVYVSDTGLDSRMSVYLFRAGFAEVVEDLVFLVSYGGETQEASLLYVRRVPLPEGVKKSMYQKGWDPTPGDAAVAYLSWPSGVGRHEEILLSVQRPDNPKMEVMLRMKPEWRDGLQLDGPLTLVGNLEQRVESIRRTVQVCRRRDVIGKFRNAGRLLQYFFAENVPAESKMKLLGWIEDLPDSHVIVSPAAKREIQERWGNAVSRPAELPATDGSDNGANGG